MNNIRQRTAGGLALLLSTLTTASCRANEALALVLAQEGGVTVTKNTKNYIVEILVTVALFGLALWVVCRSSNRV